MSAALAAASSLGMFHSRFHSSVVWSATRIAWHVRRLRQMASGRPPSYDGRQENLEGGNDGAREL
jgi:hypothetical protein